MREIRDGDHRTGAARCARRANLDRNDAKRTQALFAKRLKWPPTFGAVRLQCRQLGDIRRNPSRLIAREQCPLYPRKRTLELSRAMSALCQKQTSIKRRGQGDVRSHSGEDSASRFRRYTTTA